MVDDIRATDNAWMETIALHFHDEEGILDNLKLEKNSAVWAELRDQVSCGLDSGKYKNLGSLRLASKTADAYCRQAKCDFPVLNLYALNYTNSAPIPDSSRDTNYFFCNTQALSLNCYCLQKAALPLGYESTVFRR